ncbi:hypothetical protein [Halomonas sp. Alg239-R46]|jgi:hypothetical protein|nr:hypothetical protein [Halomonas sp. Alg239-R46]
MQSHWLGAIHTASTHGEVAIRDSERSPTKLVVVRLASTGSTKAELS